MNTLENNKIYVFDNIINIDEQNKIKNILLGGEFPWYFSYDITRPVKVLENRRPGFFHYFYINGDNNSASSDLIKNIIENSCKKIKFKYKCIFNSRCFLQLPLNLSDKKIDTPHTDILNDHMVVLYYVIDNEAETIIYKEKKSKDNLEKPKKLTIFKKVKPKQGRVVIFNGHHWHTAKQPTKNERCIINTNLI